MEEPKQRKTRVHKKPLLVPYPIDLEPEQLSQLRAIAEQSGDKVVRLIRKLIDKGLERVEIPEKGYTISVYQVKKEHTALVKKVAKEMKVSESQVVSWCIEEQLIKTDEI